MFTADDFIHHDLRRGWTRYRVRLTTPFCCKFVVTPSGMVDLRILMSPLKVNRDD